MRIKESQLRSIVRKEIKALMEADEEQPEAQATPEEQPKPEPEEEGPSKATQFAEKIVDRLRREPELATADAMVDIITQFLTSMDFSSEAKLTILKTVKTNTIH